MNTEFQFGTRNLDSDAAFFFFKTKVQQVQRRLEDPALKVREGPFPNSNSEYAWTEPPLSARANAI